MRPTVFMIAVIGSTLAALPGYAQSELPPEPPGPALGLPEELPLQPASIWKDEVGGGFRSSVQTITLGQEDAIGLKILGTTQSHDLALVSLSYGHMLGRTVWQDHWYRGNWEIRGELFGGSQFHPGGDWLVGLAPHLRYNFDTGTRWIPFVDAGLGVSATEIRRPDLSGTFEFNLQGGLGMQWFMRDNFALSLEAGYMHLSDAGISKPNNGVNGVKIMAGVNWFF